jgi:signal transduction histidine kinase
MPAPSPSFRRAGPARRRAGLDGTHGIPLAASGVTPGPPHGRASALETQDLATFNRWLCISRLRAVAGVGFLLVALQLVAPGTIDPAPVVVVLAVLVAVALAGLRSARLAKRPARLFHLQNLIDLAAITAGIAAGAHGTTALLMRLLFVLVIVPASLVSVRTGLLVATLAAGAHLGLLAAEHGTAGVAGVEGLVPVVLFFLISQQCFFYGGQLAEKNRVLRTLIDVARTLGAALEAPELLDRMTRRLRELAEADWVATFLVDPAAGTFRVVGVTGLDVPLGELARLDFPLSGWPDLAGLAQDPVVTVEGAAAAHVPAAFTGARRLAAVRIGGLWRDDALIGFVAAGWEDADRVPRGTDRMLAGVAEHAAIALRNAQLLDEVRLASELKSEFVGAISHELRSPLNVILGYSEMLREGALGDVTPEQAAALDRTYRQALVLLEMITALLDLNRLDAGRLPIEGVTLGVGELVDELVEQVPEEWRREGVVLRVVVEPDLPAIVTDPGKLKTVLRNLVHNALKFTTRGHVTISAGMGPGGTVVFGVRDTGRGIPAEALPYVFEMFRQVPGSGGGGVGLGLHIVRRFVEALGGSVDVTSTVGMGTCFTVTMPAAIVVRHSAVA